MIAVNQGDVVGWAYALLVVGIVPITLYAMFELVRTEVRPLRKRTPEPFPEPMNPATGDPIHGSQSWKPNSFIEYGVAVKVWPSAGSDGAIVVHIDTDFEPEGTDGDPGLRVLLNDDDAYVGVPYRAWPPGEDPNEHDGDR